MSSPESQTGARSARAQQDVDKKRRYTDAMAMARFQRLLMEGDDYERLSDQYDIYQQLANLIAEELGAREEDRLSNLE